MVSGNMPLIRFCKYHLEIGLVALWIIMIPLSVITGWVYSVAFVSAISLYANVASHWAAYRAQRAERKMDDG